MGCGKVYIVHCVDTEGPLNESLEAAFQRIEVVSGIRLSPSKETLKKIQNKQLELDGYEEILATAFSERIMAYNKDWSYLDAMLDNLTSKEFRQKYADPNGNGWQYTWFIMDHVDYEDNPRSKITGYNSIWNHYKEYYRLHCIEEDEFQWHVHPANAYNSGNHCGVSYWNSPHVLQSLCHRLIDGGVFPLAFRAGFHTERADSHWLLEQYIPFDFSNQAIKTAKVEDKQIDLAGGRFGDWRRARSDWGWYHPSHSDYQTVGTCNRIIFRCLNVGTRLRLITQEEVDKAFQRAGEGKDTILAFCDHDFREIKYDVEEVFDYVKCSASKFPDVAWENATAAHAAKKVTGIRYEEINIITETEQIGRNRVKINIETNIESFGIQPFFAIKMRGNIYRAEQLDIQIPYKKWSYVFDDDTIYADDIELIGIATNSKCGSGALIVIDLDNQVIKHNKW